MVAAPPFIGSWPNNTGTIGAGEKKKTSKGKGLLLGKNSPFDGILLVGTILLIKHCPIDIINWVKSVKIKQFMGVFSGIK